jgi:succinate dehydrogenase / fumarate reductase iron-sulfur subunit
VPERTIQMRISRRENANSEPFWQEFEIPYKAGHNVISLLMEIRRNPITREG